MGLNLLCLDPNALGTGWFRQKAAKVKNSCSQPAPVAAFAEGTHILCPGIGTNERATIYSNVKRRNGGDGVLGESL